MWGGVEVSRPPWVRPGCPRLSLECDMGRETFCLSPAVKTQNRRDWVVSEQGTLCGAVRDAGAEGAGQGCSALGGPGAPMEGTKAEPLLQGFHPHEILSAAFKEQVGLPCVLHLGVRVRRLVPSSQKGLGGWGTALASRNL